MAATRDLLGILLLLVFLFTFLDVLFFLFFIVQVSDIASATSFLSGLIAKFDKMYTRPVPLRRS